MGEVRETLEDKSSKSPKVRLRQIREDLADLITRKKQDLVSEGDAARATNSVSVARLETADFHLKQAAEILEAY